jgi:hypothetical protein
MARERIRRDTVYQFDELSESAKDTARDWYRQCTAEDFVDCHAESVIDDAARLLALIGVDIKQRSVRLMNGGTRNEPDVYFAVADRSAGVSYSARYAFAAGGVELLEAEAPSVYDGKPQKQNAAINRIARALDDVQSRNENKILATVSHNRRVRDFAIDIDVEHEDDNDLLSAEDVSTVEECFEDIAHWLHQQLENEWEYQHSDEQVDENIRANEYEFMEDGRRA